MGRKNFTAEAAEVFAKEAEVFLSVPLRSPLFPLRLINRAQNTFHILLITSPYRLSIEPNKDAAAVAAFRLTRPKTPPTKPLIRDQR